MGNIDRIIGTIKAILDNEKDDDILRLFSSLIKMVLLSTNGIDRTSEVLEKDKEMLINKYLSARKYLVSFIYELDKHSDLFLK